MLETTGKQRFQTSKKLAGFCASLTSFVARIPQRHIAYAGKLMGSLAHSLDVRHRRIVRRNLRFTHPEQNSDDVRRLSGLVFQHMGMTVTEVLQMASFSREHILRKVRIKGKENLRKALESPNGSILLSAHLGNWEMALLASSCYFQKPLVAVARPLDSKTLNRFVNGIRTKFGNIILDKKGAFPKMARFLRQGKTLGVLIDQGMAPSESVDVLFFGRRATATPAAALLARRYNSPVFPAYCIREADNRLTLIVETPLQLRETEDLRSDVQANTQMMTAALEKAIRHYEEQWNWLHKRWKQYYPQLYPEDMARRKRRGKKDKDRLRKMQEIE